jgi:hypothetical protein
VAKAGKGDFQAGLNALGEDGWELVSIEAGASLGRGAPGPRPSAAYSFKRAKAAAGKQIPLGPAGAAGAKGKGAPSPKELNHHLLPEKLEKSAVRVKGWGRVS